MHKEEILMIGQESNQFYIEVSVLKLNGDDTPAQKKKNNKIKNRLNFKLM